MQHVLALPSPTSTQRPVASHRAEPRPRTGLTLRPYQRTAAAEVLDLINHDRDPLFTLPTGGGKTAVASSVIEEVAASGRRVLFTVHRDELLIQASARLRRMQLEHGLIMPGQLVHRDRILLGSIATLHRRKDRYQSFLSSINLVVPDEAHHYVDNAWSDVLEAMPNANRFGLSATPGRFDGKGLNGVFSDLVYGPDVGELTSMGFLSPLQTFSFPLSFDLSKVRIQGGDYVPADLEAILDNPAITEPAVKLYSRLITGRPCIVFCATVNHAIHVAEQFTAAGYRAAAVFGSSATHRMEPEEARAILGGLATGSTQVVCACDLISEGVDLPDVVCGIMLRPTRSVVLFLQQAGRLLRIAKGKANAILIDLVRNVLAHGMVEDEREWSLEGGAENGRARHAVERCPRCCACRVEDEAIERCPVCGAKTPKRRAIFQPDGIPARRPKIAAAARSIAAMTDEAIKGTAYRTLMKRIKTKADLERVANVRNYSAGWVWHRLNELELANGG